MSRYSVARRDFEFLETLAELADQMELDACRGDLMKNPTKAHAAELYEAAISLWFVEHSGKFDNKRVKAIVRRYGDGS